MRPYPLAELYYPVVLKQEDSLGVIEVGNILRAKPNVEVVGKYRVIQIIARENGNTVCLAVNESIFNS
jgi:hypothetical protein